VLLLSLRIWKQSPFLVAALTIPFLMIDVTFLAANLLKIFEGGWFQITLAAAISIILG
jgi:KUP system potassium uptake protein